MTKLSLKRLELIQDPELYILDRNMEQKESGYDLETFSRPVVEMLDNEQVNVLGSLMCNTS